MINLTDSEISLLRVQLIVAVRAGHCQDVYFRLYEKLGGQITLASLLETPRTE
jgi:hypothetical protein